MRKYIFLTSSITSPGGIQCYVASKAEYLKSQGWDVHVMGANDQESECLIHCLNKYLHESILELSVPPFCLTKKRIQKTLGKMYMLINPAEIDEDTEIIIESHEAPHAFWGELLARQLKARHFFYTMNEKYRGKNRFYESMIDFFKFKYNRGEILGNIDTLSRLFEGHISITRNEYPEDVIINESPVADIVCEKVDNLTKLDWNISYLGRGIKPYVENIINDIGVFASKNPNKSIQFIAISDLSTHAQTLNKILNENKNLTYVNLGYLHPIPKNFFSKIDVMIAGSGSARHSTEEGVPTIVADPEHKKSNGVLGYETMNSLFQDSDSVVSSFTDALERVLITKEYLQLEYKYNSKITIEESTKQNFRLYSKSDKSKIYYSRDKLIIGPTLNFDRILLKIRGMIPIQLKKKLRLIRRFLHP